ncbi:hypothetical protein [Paenibacillus sp. ATY16]|uniref:hypothetical protein n=1 Tax=Paenibacillus sp. ATY16 TaxID=1759312 RepID=UPI00200BE3B1|nr:hypothetical protein [Paenibacillus sp. ATY16]MCK9858313.1 hypothetical protein [Paenibacillus sp. ATY16]
MSFAFFTTGYFFSIYIGAMALFCLWYFNRIYLKRYRNAHKESILIQQEIQKLHEIDNIAERFNHMNQWVQNQTSPYTQECFEPAWRAFYKKFMEYQRNGVTFTPDVFDYFHEEIFIHKYGKRKLAELIPGLFLAAGIFGTFLGIFSGVSQLDPGGNANEMRSGIGLLLSGMKVKFLSSMAGIIMSSLWQYLDKRQFLPSLTESYYRIRESMDDAFPTQEESTVLYRMLQNQEKHMQDFQAFMSEKMIPQMMAGFGETINGSLLPPLVKTQSLIGELMEKEEKQMLDFQNYLSEEMIPQVLNGYGKSINESILPSLVQTQSLIGELVENEEKHMFDFQTFMSEKIIPQVTTGFGEAINGSLLPPLVQTQSLIGELVEKASVNQIEGMRQLTSEVMNSLNEITGEHMKNLGEALRKTIEWQQQVHDDMSGLISSMQESAREQTHMADKTTNLTEQINTYTVQVTEYQQVIESTVAQLNETASKNSEIDKAISELLDRMVEEREIFHTHFEDHIGRFQQNVESIITQTALQDSVQKQLEHNLGQITNMAESQQQLVTALSEYAIHSEKSGAEITQLLQRFEKNASTYIELQENMRGILELSGEERKRMDKLAESIQGTLVDQVAQMDNRNKAMTAIWESSSNIMTKMNTQLATSMNQFTDDMHRGLNRTFEQFDEELTKSVGLLAKGVDAMRDGMVELPDVIQDLKKSVIEMNKLAKQAANL